MNNKTTSTTQPMRSLASAERAGVIAGTRPFVLSFNDLLAMAGIDAAGVIVLRHRAREDRLNRVLPSLAADHPDLFNAYQQTQGRQLARAMTKARYLASFLAQRSGRALFVGLYEIGASRPLTHEAFWQDPAHIKLGKLGKLGMTGFQASDKRNTIQRFDLTATDFYADWKGKLLIGWPYHPRPFSRRAQGSTFPVLAIHEESALVDPMPDWQDLVLDWAELAALPRSWRVAMSQWRGVYHIVDTRDGKAYVGSAYGADNMLGRWFAAGRSNGYAATGHGGNRLLKGRNPETLQFSILQLVAPGTAPDEVIRLETAWKHRLATRLQGLNVN